MKRVITAIAVSVMLSGCSASSALTGLIGSKPEITAQAGAENVKQTVGVTAKQDTSSKQETTIKDSKVERVESSSRKQVKTSTIQANEIKAESITVNGSDPIDDLPILVFSAACMLFAGFLSGVVFAGRNKGA